jgi:hypothetical protein
VYNLYTVHKYLKLKTFHIFIYVNVKSVSKNHHPVFLGERDKKEIENHATSLVSQASRSPCAVGRLSIGAHNSNTADATVGQPYYAKENKNVRLKI